MAWFFDTSDSPVNRVVLARHDNMNFPDGDWTFDCWLKIDNSAGSAFKYCISWDLQNATSSFNWYFSESTDTLTVNMEDGSSTNRKLISSTTPHTDLTWQYICAQRDGANLQLYINGTNVATTAVTTFNDITESTDFWIGSRKDNNEDRHFQGDMCEIAKWDRALSATERAGRLKKFSANWYPDQLKMYCPAVREFQEAMTGTPVTNTGATASEHLDIIYPTGFFSMGVPAAAVGGATPKGPLGQVVLWGPFAGPLAY